MLVNTSSCKLLCASYRCVGCNFMHFNAVTLAWNGNAKYTPAYSGNLIRLQSQVSVGILHCFRILFFFECYKFLFIAVYLRFTLTFSMKYVNHLYSFWINVTFWLLRTLSIKQIYHSNPEHKIFKQFTSHRPLCSSIDLEKIIILKYVHIFNKKRIWFFYFLKLTIAKGSTIFFLSLF